MNNIVKYRSSPFHTLSLFDELDNWDGLLNMASSNFSQVPSIDVTEDEKSFNIKADVPDYEKGDINVALEDGYLTISGQKHKDEKEEKKNYLRRERFYSKFEKTIRLDEQIDADNVKASLKNGVLELTLPKKEVKKIDRKKINVE